MKGYPLPFCFLPSFLHLCCYYDNFYNWMLCALVSFIKSRPFCDTHKKTAQTNEQKNQKEHGRRPIFQDTECLFFDLQHHAVIADWFPFRVSALFMPPYDRHPWGGLERNNWIDTSFGSRTRRWKILPNLHKNNTFGILPKVLICSALPEFGVKFTSSFGLFLVASVSI